MISKELEFTYIEEDMQKGAYLFEGSFSIARI
jgi:hypothetical protein